MNLLNEKLIIYLYILVLPIPFIYNQINYARHRTYSHKVYQVRFIHTFNSNLICPLTFTTDLKSHAHILSLVTDSDNVGVYITKSRT